MNYDGTTKIGYELAKLYDCSPNSNNKIAGLMAEAREALNLGNGKKLTSEQNMAIWRYHRDKVDCMNNPTNNNDVNNPINESPSYVIIPTTSHDSNIPTRTIKATEGVFKLINFGVKLGGNRTVISLEQYIVDALKGRFALADNSGVRQWVEQAMADIFDANAPIMRQIRFTIFQALINA